MNLKIDNFVLAILVVTALAYFFPSWGSSSSPLPLDLIGHLGVALIFFFYGLKLSPAQLVTGLKNWKLHLLVQGSTFLIFPLIVLLFYPFARTAQSQTIWLAFLFLAALPSTVSSSVVMVSIAKGNLPAAIFNASISGLIGIVVTPLWMGLFLQRSNTDFHLGTIYVKLITEILLPVAIGLLLQPYGGKQARAYSRYLTLFDKSIILLIIYKSFAESFMGNVFSSVRVTDLLLIGLASSLLFYSVYFLSGYLADRLGFSPEDRITVQFCGSKKSLVHGTVFSKILFQHAAATGIMLLPLMLFHAIQIFIVSVIASRLGSAQ
jgi:sodium/bile acid cotransporter 7